MGLLGIQFCIAANINKFIKMFIYNIYEIQDIIRK